MVLVLLEVGERDLDDAALESIVGVLETGRPVHQGLANTAGKSVSSKFLEAIPFRPFVSSSLLRRDSLSDVEGVRSL